MDDPENRQMNLQASDTATIVVTDSGLGGLSVFAAIAESLANTCPWSGMNLVYFNAWPEKDRGYNHYPDMTYKARVFDNALSAMARLDPDALVIACNTLSVIYPYTDFSNTTTLPVHDIIGRGVDMIAAGLARDPETGVILFSTPTTAGSRIHAQELICRGIAPDRIINQGCINLAGTIERNPFNPDLPAMIQDNVNQAMAAGAKRFRGVAAGLCCTHFGYCSNLFSATIAGHTSQPPLILNPNQALADQVLFQAAQMASRNGMARSRMPEGQACPPSKMDIRIMSRVPWDRQRITAYETLFAPHAPGVAKALINYHFNPDLFKIQS
jgi:glutamate racemase